MRARCTTRSVARIHVSLVDLSASFPRIDGGAGLIIEMPRYVVSAEVVEKGEVEVRGDLGGVALRCARALLERLCKGCGAHVDVLDAYPLHIGLGGTTQLCLSTARSLSSALGLDLSSTELAKMVGRGGTSGIGVLGFDLGGFIADGGHSFPQEKSSPLPSDISRAPPPPLISRLEIPESWGFVLVRPLEAKRICGEEELALFSEAAKLPREEFWAVAHRILMGIMPSIASADLELFGTALLEIQGLGFKRLEWAAQDQAVWRARRVLKRLGLSYGLSSMGPTIFIPCHAPECEAAASRILASLGSDYEVKITRPRNSGAETWCG